MNVEETCIQITCDHCGNDVKESFYWFTKNCSFACPNCSYVINIGDKKLVMAMDNFESSIRSHGL